MLKLSIKYPRGNRNSTILNIAYGQDQLTIEIIKDNTYKIKIDTAVESQMRLKAHPVVVLRKQREQTKFYISSQQK